DHVRGIQQPRNRLRPRYELVTTRRVVPGAANDDELVAAPVDRAVIPDGRLGLDSAGSQLVEQQRLVVAELRPVGTGGDRDLHGTQRWFSSCHVGGGPGSSSRLRARMPLSTIVR